MAFQATMKDVAEAAGVSVGTVSNVLKGDRRVSLSMVQRVRTAIRTTGYRSHVQSRPSGKSRKTRCIGVVAPSVQDSNFAGIFTGVNQVMAENGYVVELCLTSEIQAREQRAIEQFVKQDVEGMVIVTCQPDSASMFRSVYDNGTPLVFVEREPLASTFPFAGFASAQHIEELMRRLFQEGCRRPLLITGPRENSSEADCANGFLGAVNDLFGGGVLGQALIETNFNKESAFSALVDRLAVQPIPDVIVTTSSQLLAGAMQAVKMLELDNEPHFASLGTDTWAPIPTEGARMLRRDSMELGEAAAALLLEILSGNNDEAKRGRRVVNHAAFDVDAGTKIRKSVRLRAKGKTLRALMLTGSACAAIEALLPAFRKNSGLPVEIDTKSVTEIGELLRDPAKRARYDIFQIDQPWLGELAEEGLLLPLDQWLEKRPEIATAWLPGVLDAYCRHNGRCFSVPFLFGAQILYYRKDLFDDPHIKSSFRKRYRYELRAPKNWREFNQIAAFFTKSLNPDSPVDYGTTLGGQCPNGAVCEYMPRLLSYHEGAFKAENMLESLASREAEEALANYVESYRYAPPGSPDFWWDEQAALFGDGQTAMMILFVAHVASLADRRHSKVVGRIGYDVIPGGKPMLGGWTLGVNRESLSRESALDFIGWTCDQNLVVPMTILGGSPPANKIYHNSELCALYPWLPKAVESFVKSSERNISKVTTKGKIEERVFESVLGGAVHAAVTGKLSPLEALRAARRDLEKLIGQR